MRNLIRIALIALLFVSCGVGTNSSEGKTYIPLSEVSYDIDWPNLDYDYSYDVVVILSIHGDDMRSWAEYAGGSSGNAISWKVICYNESHPVDDVLTSGKFSFNEESPLGTSIMEQREIRFELPKSPLCQSARAITLEFEKTHEAYPADIDLSSIKLNFVNKGLSADSVIARISQSIEAKNLELVKAHSTILKVSNSKQSLYCMIDELKEDILNDGTVKELSTLFESQFGKLEDQKIECKSDEDKLEIDKLKEQLKFCASESPQTDAVLCAVYQNYQSIMNWYHQSQKLLNEVSQGASLSVDLEKERLDLNNQVKDKIAKGI